MVRGREGGEGPEGQWRGEVCNRGAGKGGKVRGGEGWGLKTRGGKERGEIGDCGR